MSKSWPAFQFLLDSWSRFSTKLKVLYSEQFEKVSQVTQFLAKMLWYVHLFEKKSDSKVDKNSDFVPNVLLVPGICHIQ